MKGHATIGFFAVLWKWICFPFIWSWQWIIRQVTKKEVQLKMLSALVATMFGYAAITKLRNYEQSNWEMRNQVFPDGVADVLTWLVPVIELIVAVFLLLTPTRLKGFWASLALLVIFTLYISITLTNVFGRIPCSCGGVIGELSYGWHVIFNLFFIMVILVGIGLESGWRLNKISNWFKQKWYTLKIT